MSRLRELWRTIDRLHTELFITKYRSALQREARLQEDAFLATLYLAARRRGLTRRAALSAMGRGVRQGAIIVDGVTVSGGGPPPVDEAVDLVLRSLAASTGGRTPDTAA